MKLRIFASMLMLVCLSLFNSFTASAHGGCKKDNCCRPKHHATWGHHGYIYGPDGYYSKHKGECAGKCEKKCAGESKSCCDKKAACTKSCDRTYTRARYQQDCCGHGHLHTEGKSND
jgi:hypothetical protein